MMNSPKFENQDKVYVDFGDAGKVGPAKIFCTFTSFNPSSETYTRYGLKIDIGGLGLEGDIYKIKGVDEDLLIPAEDEDLKEVDWDF